MKARILFPVFLLVMNSCCNNGGQSALLETSPELTGVEISGGKIAGYIDNGVYVYKGIPYAEAERFMPAHDPKPWDGIRSCRSYGPVSPQGDRAGWRSDDQAFAYHWNDGYQGEDCLRVNVWTAGINDGRKRPVMVWLHGGGFSAGSGQEHDGYDGRALARNHDVVVVSLNHRLNVLGFLDLSAFGEKYAASGNVGMTDIVKALEWVRDNIAAFGGDPANVTIFGQSGGGGKVCALLSMPSAKGLFSKAIVQSGSILEGIPQKYARLAGKYTAEELGIRPARIDDIAKVPYKTLLEANGRAVDRLRAVMEADGVTQSNLLYSMMLAARPVVDGRILPANPGDEASIELSKDIPVIIGTTHDEFTVGRQDEIFKPLAVRQAEARAAHGCAPVYFYQFDWTSPLLDGAFGSMHCMEIPFVFDNVAFHNTMTGGSPDAIALGHRISSLWTSFARTGKPQAKGMPAWKPYLPGEGPTLHLNTLSTLE